MGSSIRKESNLGYIKSSCLPNQNAAFSSCYCSVWYGFKASFIQIPFYFEKACPLPDRKTYTATAKSYLTLLCNHDVPALREKNAILVVTFMQAGAPPHVACEAKMFFLETFIKDRVSRGC